MKRNSIIFALIIILSACTSSQTDNIPVADVEKKPKNIILLIGDGMGLSQISASYYFGDKKPVFDEFATVGLIKTSSSKERITDSAAGATAFSTGAKTYNGAVAVDDQKAPLKTILEIVSEQGIHTGMISTSSITHATPAAFISHVESRGMQEEVARQIVSSPVNFLAGGGIKWFNQRTDSLNLFPQLIENGFVVDTVGFGKNLEVNSRYAYFLAPDGMPRMLDGRGDFLPDATNQALKYLSQNEKGFFLMVEGSQIDWGGHANDSEYLTTEMLDFQKAIKVALEFAEKEGNTLVIVTADHETGGFTLSSTPTQMEGGMVGSDYDKITPTFSTSGHSATLIPVFSFGPGSEDFGGVYENTKIFDKMRKATGW